jgi:hypothetical protein
MGIFDFLSDLSSKRGKELDLGGLKSLLGTRKAAEAGARGDEMMKITGGDSLPGYFNPETREYVPWYVDLFDGGGLNQSEGLLGKDAQEIPSAVGLLETNGAPVQRAEQMRPQMRPDPLDPFGGSGPNIPENPLGPFGGVGPNIPENPLGPFGGSGPNIPENPLGPFGGSGPNIPPQQMQPAPQAVPRDSVLNNLRKEVYTTGPIEAISSIFNGSPTPDVPMTQPFAGVDDTPRLSEMQTSIVQHPKFPEFINMIKSIGGESELQDPQRAALIFEGYLKQMGYN